eukprot:TRINITY_DN1054_c0_g1_i8.p1 TRINITY_DN1054_c0_g1~~TRINITY_DN1054_c0_g1_i8.p1  ORF type:complete len:135 (-),score=8.14 TRINITY_DN1054_c0_g1_i8:256-660(-)
MCARLHSACVADTAISERTSHLHSLRKGVIEGGVQNSYDETDTRLLVCVFRTRRKWVWCGFVCVRGNSIVRDVCPQRAEALKQELEKVVIIHTTNAEQHDTTRHNTTSHRTTTTVSLLPLSLPGTWMRVGAATL